MQPTPTAQPQPPATARPRFKGAVLMACCLGVLLFAAHLDSPIEAQARADAGERAVGLGTFGYPGCGFKRVTGLPCASCGMTTAFTYMVDGHIVAGFNAQPVGALLCVFTAMLALVGAWAMISAMPLGPLWRAVFRVRHVVIAVGLVLAVWVFNILRHLGA